MHSFIFHKYSHYYLNKKRSLFKKTKLKGLQVSLKGRLKGVRRARKNIKHFGTVAPNSLRKVIKFNQQPIYTKWGIWNLKVHLYRRPIL